MKATVRIVSAQARKAALEVVRTAPEGMVVEVRPSTRTLEQNAAQWPILTAFSRQLQWPVNGRLEWMTPEEWKDVLTSAFRQQQPRLAAGLDGGVVMLGMRTSQMGKAEFSEWLDFLHAVAADRGVEL